MWPKVDKELIPLIVTTLKGMEGKRITLLDLHTELLRQGHRYAYSTVNRWATVAHAQRKIRMEKFGHIKVVWYE